MLGMVRIGCKKGRVGGSLIYRRFCMVYLYLGISVSIYVFND